jgi:hypothetical protein
MRPRARSETLENPVHFRGRSDHAVLVSAPLATLVARADPLPTGGAKP